MLSQTTSHNFEQYILNGPNLRGEEKGPYQPVIQAANGPNFFPANLALQ